MGREGRIHLLPPGMIHPRSLPDKAGDPPPLAPGAAGIVPAWIPFLLHTLGFIPDSSLLSLHFSDFYFPFLSIYFPSSSMYFPFFPFDFPFISLPPFHPFLFLYFIFIFPSFPFDFPFLSLLFPFPFIPFFPFYFPFLPLSPDF